MSAEQFPLEDREHCFSPLWWPLAVMLELERRTGTTEISRIEFAMWEHTTNVYCDLMKAVDNIFDLCERRKQATLKRKHDKDEIAKREEHYTKKVMIL